MCITAGKKGAVRVNAAVTGHTMLLPPLIFSYLREIMKTSPLTDSVSDRQFL